MYNNSTKNLSYKKLQKAQPAVAQGWSLPDVLTVILPDKTAAALSRDLCKCVA